MNYGEEIKLGGTSKYSFNPNQDISAYDLAQLLPILVIAWKGQGGNVAQLLTTKEIPSDLNETIKALPTELRVHFSPPAS